MHNWSGGPFFLLHPVNEIDFSMILLFCEWFLWFPIFIAFFSHFKVDDNGKDWPWSNNPSGNCNECLGDKEVCGQEICVASNKDSLARTFKSVCNFLEKYHDAKDIRTLHVGLGKCSGLFGEGSMHFRIIFLTLR